MTNEEAERIKNVAIELLGIYSEAIAENQTQEQKKKEFFDSTKDSKVIYFADYKKILDRDKEEPTTAVAVKEDVLQLNKEENKEKTQLLFDDFTEKEKKQMPKEFKKEFKKGKIKANVRLQSCGVYEIRCQHNNIKITASSKMLETAKEKFIEKLTQAMSSPTIQKNNKVNFKVYMQNWLETVKKPYIKENSYKDYIVNINKHIYPKLGDKKIKDISLFELQELINSLTKQGKFRTATKIYQLLYSLFDYAVVDEVVPRSPMLKVKVQHYEKEHGQALTREEEKILVNKLNNDANEFIQAYCFIMYTGLRRSELATMEMSDNWVKVKTAKQRKGLKDKYRKIPISPMLKKILPLIDIEKIIKVNVHTLTGHIKKIFPTHHLHELRHTFITRCQECGIQREIVSLWSGHSADSSITTLVYTHLEQNEQHQLEEMQKFAYDL